jgi:hypothetical protein
MSNVIKPIFKASTCKFGNGYVQYIDEFPIKKQILEYLYTCLKYTDWAINDSLETVNESYSVSPFFKGFNYIMMATLVNKLPAVLLIEKDELKESLNDVSFNTVKILKAKTNLPLENFLGTIIDGQTIREATSPKLHFVVNNIMYLNGSCVNGTLKEKFELIDKWISSFTVSSYDPFDFRLPPLYTKNDYSKLVKALTHLEFPINGLLFHSTDGKQRFYFVEQQRGSDISKVITQVHTEPVSTNELIDTYYKQMLLTKTGQPDVYNVIDPSNNKPCGFALVQTMTDSHKLADLFQSTQKCMFKCVFSEKFGKWKPISQVN